MMAPALPFGGVYRIIDFTLSNCTNSDVRRIFILTQYKALELIRHIRDGWNILSSELGEYIDPETGFVSRALDASLVTARLSSPKSQHAALLQDSALPLLPAA